MRRQSILCMEAEQQSHQNDYECETDTENIVSHRAGNDKVAVLAASAGLSFITRSLGGSEASAPAANVSIIRFTQSIWVIVSGDSVPNREPNKTIRQAATLIVNWNNRNFWMVPVQGTVPTSPHG